MLPPSHFDCFQNFRTGRSEVDCFFNFLPKTPDASCTSGCKRRTLPPHFSAGLPPGLMPFPDVTSGRYLVFLLAALWLIVYHIKALAATDANCGQRHNLIACYIFILGHKRCYPQVNF